ncbi:hypothetical protein [Curtobacterium sp. RIT-PI-V]|uniref:hypothetical protein n=1 Tax=Curtobacterium sp. RIT-PI-V TaxID=3035296 RepID=UPI0021DA7513|nr:hypothetical protein [Curtobacterium sp. RIT-PI-V]
MSGFALLLDRLSLRVGRLIRRRMRSRVLLELVCPSARTPKARSAASFCAHVDHQLDCTPVDLKLAAEQYSKLPTFGKRRMSTITLEEVEAWPFS